MQLWEPRELSGIKTFYQHMYIDENSSSITEKDFPSISIVLRHTVTAIATSLFS